MIYSTFFRLLKIESAMIIEFINQCFENSNANLILTNKNFFRKHPTFQKKAAVS